MKEIWSFHPNFLTEHANISHAFEFDCPISNWQNYKVTQKADWTHLVTVSKTPGALMLVGSDLKFTIQQYSLNFNKTMYHSYMKYIGTLHKTS